MSQAKVPPPDRIVSSFKQLAASSNDLNIAATHLGTAISALNAALRNINIGVSAWHKITGNEDDWGNYWSREIGYAKVGREWGISLRKRAGNHESPDADEEEVWLFNDAPRWMCVESVGKIPDLFDALIKRTEETTKQIKAKTNDAKAFAEAITAIAAEVTPQRK